ncbi:aconitate hydratase AcnA [Domibacillus enclensis]|uniref:Aconitate hydratase n=1 Tax=Domibacillus enclensis TaxID=1017273 RepID=A0A1N6V354_9BACI|nr:aconitate hydratase AcnA [Domibacillus enclensis]OXS78688.1 aconitate hydratase [Domibacillus enclensis]SIQ72305.1 aconitase [Domibacillus enclensis]
MSKAAFMKRAHFDVGGKKYTYYPIRSLNRSAQQIDRLPYSIKVLLEAAVRTYDGETVTEDHIRKLTDWTEKRDMNEEVPFKPARILLHDTTGLPAIVDLAAMRETVYRAGGNVAAVNPLIPVDLVVDHSVTVDYFGRSDAMELNEQINMKRNMERFRFLRWAQQSFDHLQVIPPATGIMHQINMEYLSAVAVVKEEKGELLVFPDSLVGTDSHTTMINGLGIVAWGVGGIEAEAAMLGQPLYFVTPEVIGFRLSGRLMEGTTATDLALTITNILREKNVVGKFVEFFGPGVQTMSVADRATIANMAPEYGATMGFFPVDDQTLHYLRLIGRSEEQVSLIEAYYKVQGLFVERGSTVPDYPEVIELDLTTVVSSVAGPKRPQDRVNVTDMKQGFRDSLRLPVEQGGFGLAEEALSKKVAIDHENKEVSVLRNGSVVLAAITSCTNTSNPTVLLMAGLLAKKAVESGLTKPPYVKSSLTPGSQVVTDYLRGSGLLPYLEALGFHIAGYGCATCIGNSGPLPPVVSEAITKHDLTVAGVLSGNRNFEGRVHPQIKANYLASPPLVVAYALAGTVDIDFANEPIGFNSLNEPLFLRDIWPSSEEINSLLAEALHPDLFKERYRNIQESNKMWNQIDVPAGQRFDWEEESTYIQEPPFLSSLSESRQDIVDFKGVRILALLGHSVTTDHLSPSGAIPRESAAGRYLRSRGVGVTDLNSYPSRRGNHHVMIRGALANHRIRNQLVPGSEGGVTTYLPNKEVMTMYDASLAYKKEGVPLFILAGKEYGTGSSRDWAAKGTLLLGVKAVIAESFERIHRSNLVGMGILPLQFLKGESARSLRLDGTETFQTVGLGNDIMPGQLIEVNAVRENGELVCFSVIVRLDNSVDIDYYRHGGIMQKVVRDLLQTSSKEQETKAVKK